LGHLQDEHQDLHVPQIDLCSFNVLRFIKRIVFPESSLQRGREYEIWFFQNILKRDFTKSIFTIPKLGASTRFNGCHNRTQPQTDGKKLIDDNDPNS